MIRSLRWWLVFLGVMCLIPIFAPPNAVRLLILANFMAIFAMSWDIMSGYTGYVSLGHPFLIGIAGYTTAILSCQGAFQPPHLVLPLYATIPLAAAVAVGGGMLLFLPAMKVRGPYFCLVSLAFLIVIHRLTIAIYPDLIGADRGLTGLPQVVTGVTPNFYLSLGLMFAVAIGLWFVARSDIGGVLKAIHMDEGAVESSGLSTYKFKLVAFILSALTAGIGGAFYTHYMASISPRHAFSTTFLINIIIAAMIGGMGTIVGPISGAYFITLILEYLRPYLIGPGRFVLYSVIALIIVVYRPRGFYGIIQDIVNWFRGKRKAETYG